MEYFYGGLIIWLASGLIGIVSISQPLVKGCDKWNFSNGFVLTILIFVSGPISQIFIKQCDNDEIARLIKRGSL
ncbi:TMhelix containing protein [Vibrio phage 1.030.O._10N.222.55.F9]|nr:TMhelix containing protein [Vibrio phage 1.030.O._10N.222.55.F9]